MRFPSLNECKRHVAQMRAEVKESMSSEKLDLASSVLLTREAWHKGLFARLHECTSPVDGQMSDFEPAIRAAIAENPQPQPDLFTRELQQLEKWLKANPDYSTVLRTAISYCRRAAQVREMRFKAGVVPEVYIKQLGAAVLVKWGQQYGQVVDLDKWRAMKAVNSQKDLRALGARDLNL